MDEAALVENRTFDEIEVGESASFERAITRRDIELFAAVSGDANPTHLDEAFAKAASMDGVVAHGMLTAGLIAQATRAVRLAAATVTRRAGLRASMADSRRSTDAGFILARRTSEVMPTTNSRRR